MGVGEAEVARSSPQGWGCIMTVWVPVVSIVPSLLKDTFIFLLTSGRLFSAPFYRGKDRGSGR